MKLKLKPRKRKPTSEMNEAEIHAEVTRITMRVANLLGDSDLPMMGSVLSNLLGMYLWTFPPDKRGDITAAVMQLANQLIEEGTGPKQAPLDDIMATRQ